MQEASTTVKRDILKIGFHLASYADAMETIERWKRCGRRGYVAMTPPHAVMESRWDAQMRRALQRADMVLPDGIGIILAARLLGYPNQGRTTGPTLMLRVCDWGHRQGFRHFFYGGAEGIADRLAEHLAEKYPGLQVAGTYCPPFRPLSEQEDRDVVDMINTTEPDIVWVGLGAPKQEKWMARHVGRIAATALIGVGAAFDFHSGNTKWAPSWIRKLGLEWAYRLAHDPKRLWLRNLYNPLFLAEVLGQRAMLTLGRRQAAPVPSGPEEIEPILVFPDEAETPSRRKAA